MLSSGWLFLIIAGILEISWAIGLKYSEGLTKLKPTIFTVIAMILSFVFLAKAVEKMPVGTAYAIWTGIGAVGTAILGMILFKEPATAIRMVCMLLIVAGIVGLKFSS
ncbi:MAG: quaternary ammonium compound efflux SMR transporter SugE [Bacteroidetes bacterium]|nr:quaternary ammonium compound efflux SMR transporter SugE [Bacteroidota bacterium]